MAVPAAASAGVKWLARTVLLLHVPLTLGVAAIWTPDGNASVKFKPFNAVEPLGLVSVKVSVEVPPTAMVLGEKALSIVGTAVDVAAVSYVTLSKVIPKVHAAVPVMVTLVTNFGVATPGP